MLTRNKNFKYLFLGRLFSNAGDSIYYVAISWYILEVTKDPFWVGVINFCMFFPNIFAFMFGKIIDYRNKKNILLFLELAQAVFLVVLIIFIFLKINNPIYISIIVFCISLFACNTYTVQNVMLPIIVEKDNITKANQYMSMAYNTSDYLFNALSGFLITVISNVQILFINLISFFIAIFNFSKINYTEPKKKDAIEDAEFWKGFNIIKNRISVLSLIIISSIGNFLFGGFVVYQVIISKTYNGPIFYGILLSIISLGVLFGNSIGVNIFLNKMKFTHGQTMILSEFLFGLFLVVSSFVVKTIYVLPIFFVFSIFLGVKHVVFPVFYQTTIHEDDLGRFYSAQYTIEILTLPLGSLFFGYFAKFINPSWFMLVFGLFYLAFSVLENMITEIKKFKV